MKTILKPRLRLYRAPRLNVKGFMHNIINPLKTVSFSTLFMIFLLLMVSAVFVSNKIRMQHFTNLIVNNYPEISVVPATEQGKPAYPSVIDKILADFNSVNNTGYLLFFAILLRKFLLDVWRNYNPRKPQVMVE